MGEELLTVDTFECDSNNHIMTATNTQFSVAAHMMTALGFHHGKDVTSATLAESVNAAPSFVRRVLSKLAKAGLVKTTRGKNGACALARAPELISMLEIYRASEAPAAFAIHTYPVEKTCPISSNIKGCMAEVLGVAQEEFERSLAQQSLADLVAGIKKHL